MPSQTNNPIQPETAKQLDRDLDRCDRFNTAFALRSDGWTFRNVVKIEHDSTNERRPWLLWVADESTEYATLQGAINDAISSLRDAAEMLSEIDDAIK